MTSRMKELVKRLAPIIGFGIKVVERTGRSLKSIFPLSSLWDGTKCGRNSCITCSQRTEELPPCTRRSVLYENICSNCNKGAGSKGEVENKGDIPSIYVGETSRTLQERGMEHLAALKGGSERSHMRKHQELHHGGEEPTSILKILLSVCMYVTVSPSS